MFIYRRGADELYDRALIKRWKLPIKRPVAGTRDRFENEEEALLEPKEGKRRDPSFVEFHLLPPL